MPWDALLAGRTKRTARLIDRKIPRQAVNADVEERADRRAEDEGKDAKDQLVSRGRLHSLGGISARGSALHEPGDPDAALVKQTHRQTHRDQCQDIGRRGDDGREDENEHDGVGPGAGHELIGDEPET